MTIKYYDELEQGSPEWYAARCGILTASEMKHIITAKKLEYANNDKEKAHLYELLAQRINNYVEPHYIGDEMLRGMMDETEAKILYQKNYGTIKKVGFITNDKWGFKIGYSPDFVVNDKKTGEIKSRRQRFQVETIINKEVPDEHKIQVQTGLLVAELDSMDYVSYCAGMPMYVFDVFPDEKVQKAIVEAATIFEEKIAILLQKYNERIGDRSERLIPTERKIIEEMHT